MPRVAVIGAGIAGLTAAFRLHRHGIETAVFEARDRVGGVIRTERSGGFLVEHGPNSIQSAGDVLGGLIEDLGLNEERVAASEAARVRYIVRDDTPTAAPTSPARLLTSDLFRSGTKLRLLREPFVPPADPSVEESVADFIRRRLGSEVLDYGVEPFVAGVYAGDAERLSIRHAFPGFFAMEQSSGSIIRGGIRKKRGAEAAAETHRMFSFRSGLVRLPEALASALGERIRLSSGVRRVLRSERTWRVSAFGADEETYDAVVYAAPLHALDAIELPARADTAALTGVVYAPLSIVALGFRREHVRHPLDGFGMLVPRVESGLRILGTLFTSSTFPGRAPEGHALLTTFAGGMRDPDLARYAETELYDVVVRDLRKLLGISGEPVLRKHVVWEHAIPQYNIGYSASLETMDRLEHTWPGWFMAGNYRSGVSVGDTAQSGADAARRCLTYLES